MEQPAGASFFKPNGHILGNCGNRFQILIKLRRDVYLCKDTLLNELVMYHIFHHESCRELLDLHSQMIDDPLINKINLIIPQGSVTHVFTQSPDEDLSMYVERTARLPEYQIHHLFRQICHIVKVCHDMGVVLRDLQMRKFVFNGRGRLNLQLDLLTDAVILSDPLNDLMRLKRGSITYLAPEALIPCEMYSGKAADMWSLGIILYRMVTGYFPFYNPHCVGHDPDRAVFTLPPSVSGLIESLIRSLLIRDPRRRMTIDVLLDHPWMICSVTRDFGIPE